MVKGKNPLAERRIPPSTSTEAGGKTDSDAPADDHDDQIPERLQQHILNVFRDAFLQSPDFELEPVIQKVKQHLYNRDFAAAFGSEQHLLAYAARWSASRALGYLQIFHDISPYVTDSKRQELLHLNSQPASSEAGVHKASAGRNIHGSNMQQRNGDPPPYEHPPAYGVNFNVTPAIDQLHVPSMRITFLGGGAGAELVASAAWLRLQSEISSETNDSEFGHTEVDPYSLEVNCIDMADWDNIVRRLDETIKTAPVISKYASSAAKAANVAMLPSDAMESIFHQQDLLEAHSDSIRTLFRSSDLIAIMFTLNELYSTSVSKSQRLMFELTAATTPGTLLLVVDSPGSYSTVKLNNAEKKYPMQWLLDHTLLETSRNTRILPRATQWEKLLTDDSRWFRLPKGLQYPIELENMRYQIHLYRKLAVPDDAAAPGGS